MHFRTSSQLTLDSGIADGVICSDSDGESHSERGSDSDDDSDSSFHCSSWEDEEEIRQGNSVRGKKHLRQSVKLTQYR